MEVNDPVRGIKSHSPAEHCLAVKSLALIFLLLLVAIGLAGCVDLNDPEASQEYYSEDVGEVGDQTAIGQSFVSRRPRLSNITLWFTVQTDQINTPSSPVQESLQFKLFHSPTDASPLYATTLVVPGHVKSSPITINLPDQNNLAGQSFYIQLSPVIGNIQVNGRLEDAYLKGQAYINTRPVDADIAFRLSYDYDFTALLHDFKQIAPWLWLVIPLLVVLVLPGWLLLEYSGIRSHFDLGERVALSLGISLALIPILMLWTTLLKISWSRDFVLIVSVILITLFIFRVVYKYLFSPRAPLNQGSSTSTDNASNHHPRLWLRSTVPIILLVIFIVTLAIRLIMIRDLATPAWVDSVHHALITRLILQNGAYPATYLPYLDISPYSYHPGFHSVTATFTWLSGLDLVHSLLILGQVLNALAIFSVYLLTTTLTKSSTAGLFAAGLTGFITPMPAYYTSWGRYTELAGLLILPVMIALIKIPASIKARSRDYWLITLGAITAGGLFLVHYRVIVFMACLLIPCLIFNFLENRHSPASDSSRILRLVFFIAVIGILLVFPWFYQTLITTVVPVARSLTIGVDTWFQDFSWSYLTSTLGKQALVIAGLGLVWAMLKRQSFTYILVIWVASCFFIANLAALHLPGGGLINNTSVEIMLFIPISILGGYYLAQVTLAWKVLLPNRFLLPAFGIILVFCGWAAFTGAKQLVNILNPITILSREADLPAMNWIDEHIPQDETIIINPFAWGYGLYAGNDGGYWISPLAGRPTIPPPVIYGLGDGAEQIDHSTQKILSLSSEPRALYQYLSSQNLHYIYLGARGGALSAEKLVSSGLFDPIYHQDGVWIFDLKP